MTIKAILRDKLAELVKTQMKEEIISKLMERFDKEIVALEDPEDPMCPSVCRDEFLTALEESIDNSIVVTDDKISFGVGDEGQLGFGKPLDEETTDCSKIIGTILQGIVGEYVLVTSEMAKEMFPGDKNSGDLGRTGQAYLMPKSKYDTGVDKRGWEPKNSWGFSNFKGLPDFFENIDLDMDKYIKMVLDK